MKISFSGNINFRDWTIIQFTLQKMGEMLQNKEWSKEIYEMQINMYVEFLEERFGDDIKITWEDEKNESSI